MRLSGYLSSVQKGVVMRTLIVYMSHHGCSRDCAYKLKELLHREATDVVDLKSDDPPTLALYDTVIIGGSIHAGKLQSNLLGYINLSLDELLQKRVGLYLCHMAEDDEAAEEFENAYPEILRRHAIALGLFGGRFDFEKMNFIEKAIVKKVAQVTDAVDQVNYQAIADFAKVF